ncbi:MAG: UDP-N-acetylmuramoyl-L-alanyl-D-glutamate--2,6-diaminopimelate ligase [Chloroflexota bacterium]
MPPSSKILQQHLDTLPAGSVVRITGDLNLPVTAPFVEDSRYVEAGGVFVARKGLNSDGHDYIETAIERGAVAIIGEYAIDLKVPYVQVNDAQQLLGQLAASYYDFPSRDLVVVGVTGTNGKTSTTHIVHNVLREATDNQAGYISTLGAYLGGGTADTGLHVTTPTAPEIQQYLAQMRDAGLTHVVLEMTSHGLEQGRLVGVDIDVAIITNLTHEHLDFHGSFEAYRAAKGIMFDMLAKSHHKDGVPKIGITNADDANFDYYHAFEADKRVSYSIKNDADFTARKIEYAPDATHFFLGRRKYSLSLVGEFNVYNALATIAAADSMGIDNKYIKRGISKMDSVSGRMERIDEGQSFVALVDFAHTPDALEKALHAARTMLTPDNKLIAVFGSAGLRDVQKRFLMAEISIKLADMTVLTAEDPRTESLDSILNMMAEGSIAAGGKEGVDFIRVADRGQAIYEACQMAQPGDLVIACGKGHEQSMCFGVIEHPWDDRDAMRVALQGKPLLTLPTAEEA